MEYVYDIESYPNFFSCTVLHRESRTRWIFEVSDRMNNASAFYWFIRSLQYHNCWMIGFNNCNYDYQVIHHLMQIGSSFTAAHAYEKTCQIIGGQMEFSSIIWPSDYMVKQIDLYKIHHFDNAAKRTSLKTLEFNMCSHNIGDLPFPPGATLTHDQMDEVLRYNAHDVHETDKFAEYSQPQIDFRKELIPTMGISVINFNDTKIGKKYFQNELEKVAPGCCGTYNNLRQTWRDSIALADIILPQVRFETPELNNILRFLQNTTLTETKSPPELKNLAATVNGFTFHVGAGGGHGSVSRQVVRPTANEALIDIDVASYYPNLAIKNRFYPEHLSETFCDIYEDLFNQRRTYKKGTAQNAMLKLALNGVYGDSNNKYSPFYDPQYTMSITINGQLLLYMLAERLMLSTGCRMIQLNTDGITAVVSNEQRKQFEIICEEWEYETRLELEHVEYEAMWIRDVNNYIAKTTGGKIKRIGCYAYETAAENPATREIAWHKNHSALVVPKAAEAEMVHGVPAREFIMSHRNGFDFMIKGKVNGQSYLELDDGTRLQKVTRYYISKSGCGIHKTMPPLKKKPDQWRKISINKGYNVHVCDDIHDFDPHDINYEWYIREANAMVIK